MSATDPTAEKLGNITDEGLFESIATAVLREADERCRALVHSGINKTGKTIKAPVDGISFIPGSNPRHLIAAHHTIADKANLEKKWLHDPSTVIHRKSNPSKAPAGDVVKTISLLSEHRGADPSIRATLILTTNCEPDPDVVTAADLLARKNGMELEIWARSRIAHFLNFDPVGQTIRNKYLGTPVELVSRDLIQGISEKSLELHRPPADGRNWIARKVDAQIGDPASGNAIFILGPSGSGKTLAGYKALKGYFKEGGAGLVLTADIVAAAATVSDAVAICLKQIHLEIGSTSHAALDCFSAADPLLLLVDDINRSNNSAQLAEKLIRWASLSKPDSRDPRWRLICPLWPATLESLTDSNRKLIESVVVRAGSYEFAEGTDAVLAKAKTDAVSISRLEAERICSALGHDPLLIGLHDLTNTPEPWDVVADFIKRSTERLARQERQSTATDYRLALRRLACGMLLDRQMEPLWSDVIRWLENTDKRLIAEITNLGEILRLQPRGDDQLLEFRHDRVRDWLLADAISNDQMDPQNKETILLDPYFAEVVGLAAIMHEPDLIPALAAKSPLAVFHAFHLVASRFDQTRQDIVKALLSWARNEGAKQDENYQLRWAIAQKLSETDAAEVPEFASLVFRRSWYGEIARLRNGDISGGLDLCSHLEPGSGSGLRDKAIEHVLLKHSASLTKSLMPILTEPTTSYGMRIAALRLAGHLGNAALADAIQTSWTFDALRGENLDEYFWAATRCTTPGSYDLLEAICGEWAQLSDEPEKPGWPSKRGNLLQSMKFAIVRSPPLAAIPYLVNRAKQEDLHWYILNLLREIDEPSALNFSVLECARKREQAEAKSGNAWPMLFDVTRGWNEWDHRTKRPMSAASRQMLFSMWSNVTNSKQQRIVSFALWNCTQLESDSATLQAHHNDDCLYDDILRARLERQDLTAVPMLIDKLKESDKSAFWWQSARSIWTTELFSELNAWMKRRSVKVETDWASDNDADWITSEVMMRIAHADAERILIEHWSHLRRSSRFVQVALYCASPVLLEMAQEVITNTPEENRRDLFKHIGIHMGIKVVGRPGLTREEQLAALIPYLQYFDDLDISSLCELCNRRGWFALRRAHLDSRLSPNYDRLSWSPESVANEISRIVKEKRAHSVDFDIEHWLEADVSREDILGAIVSFCRTNPSSEAVAVLVRALEKIGDRQDLNLLDEFDVVDKGDRVRRADAKFAVFRRTLH